jgi:hypothetical protein
MVDKADSGMESPLLLTELILIWESPDLGDKWVPKGPRIYTKQILGRPGSKHRTFWVKLRKEV